MKALKHLRWAAAVPALFVLFASATVVFGGLRWIGMDPIVTLDDSQINITVFWPQPLTCSIDNPIEIGVIYPAGVTDARLVSESQSLFECDGTDGEVVELVTVTDLQQSPDTSRKADKVVVTTLLASSEKMPVRVEVALDGETIRECRGKSNRLITCRPFKLSDFDRDDRDDQDDEDD